MRILPVLLAALVSTMAADRAAGQVQPVRATTPGVELRLLLVDSTVLIGRF